MAKGSDYFQMINPNNDLNQKLIIYKGMTLIRSNRKNFQAILVNFHQCSDIAYYT